MAGKPTTILSWFARRRMESSICHSWSMNIKVENILRVLPSIPVNIQSTRMAKWLLPMNPRAKQPVAGGFTESRAFGRLATRTFRAWYSIPRTPVIRMPATDTQNWAAPIRTIRTSAACQASTPASSKVRNIRWK